MGFDIVRATIALGEKPNNVDGIYLIFTKTNKKVTKRNYIDSISFPPLANTKDVWCSTIIPLNPMGIIMHIDSDNAYARVNFYPEQPTIQSAMLTLTTI